MNEFANWLIKQKYSLKSIKTAKSFVGQFLSWIVKENITIETADYETVLNYINHEKQRGISKAGINNSLNTLTNYFDYLIENKQTKQNPFKTIRIKREGKRVQPEIFTPEQLEKIYNDFLNKPDWNNFHKKQEFLHQRNIVILGLLIYQAVTNSELSKLEINHINLKEGKIYIPGTIKSNARTLKLQANQILTIQNYISEKLKTKSEKLFEINKMNDLVSSIMKEVKLQHPEIIDSRQIRTSVIMNWLKQYNIRQVQYMTGHKTISSTENYRNEDLTDLTSQIEKYHPLK
jgi:integrase/recombinase XerD